MAHHQSLSPTNGLRFSQTDNQNRVQAIPQILDPDLSSLFNRISDFDNIDNEGRNGILESALQYKNTEAILIKLCNDLDRNNYTMYSFLNALVNSGRMRWVPSENLSHEDNPISLSLKTVKTIPRAIEIPRIIIAYCIRMAKQEKRFLFVSPVLGSLHELVDLQKQHTNLVLNTLRGLAFIPVPVEDEFSIISRAVIAHPLKFP